ncbi:MAG: hypothetical protein ACT4P0_09895 [Panacagrimonas sp.]
MSEKAAEAQSAWPAARVMSFRGVDAEFIEGYGAANYDRTWRTVGDGNLSRTIREGQIGTPKRWAARSVRSLTREMSDLESGIRENLAELVATRTVKVTR